MANYTATSRTNYFRVTDEKKYQELFEGLLAEDVIHDFTSEIDGVVRHGFGAYDAIFYEDEETGDMGIGYFMEKLQQILPEDEAFIYMEAGNEKLRYVTGFYAVATKDDMSFGTIGELAERKAGEMLGIPDWETRLEY